MYAADVGWNVDGESGYIFSFGQEFVVLKRIVALKLNGADTEEGYARNSVGI